MFPAGLEPATFRVLGGRDNHYTTETTLAMRRVTMKIIQFFVFMFSYIARN